MDGLEKAVYYQTIWFIRRYWDLQDEYDTILNETLKSEGRGKTNDTGNPTAVKVERLEKVSNDLKAIDDAFKIIPKDYQKGILLSIIARKRFPNNHTLRHYKEMKRKFVYMVAKNKGFI